MTLSAVNVEIAIAFLVSILAVVYIPMLASPLILNFLHKNALSDFANKNDSQLYLIKVINLIYRLKSYLKTERNVCSIDAIIVYPIKSVGKGLRVKKWDIGEFGLMYDRQYVFASFDEKKQQWIPLTLRGFDKLILVEFELANNFFIVKFGNGGESFQLPMKMKKSYLDLISAGKEIVQLWSTPVVAHDVSQLVPDSFIKFFELPQTTKLFFTVEGHPVKTAAPENLPNTIKGSKYRNATFQDYFPLLILSQNDLANLNSKLAINGYDYFEVNEFTFRPNIIVKGDIVAHDEDYWYKFRLKTAADQKGHNFTTTTKCARCMIPNIDYKEQPNKMDNSAPVSKTLSKYRRVDVGNKFASYFGVFAVQHETGYTISSGDVFDITQRRVGIYETFH